MEAAGENDDLDDGLLSKELAEAGDRWEEQKADKETLAVYNYRLKSTKYLECVIAASTSQTDFNDKQHELGLGNLSDLAKIPREVISELFEASQVSKIATQKQPDFEFKDKTTITASEVLAYTKAVVNECCMLTFGEEKARISKLISKLHRYMVACLTTYAQRCCLVVPEIAVLTEASAVEGKELLPGG